MNISAARVRDLPGDCHSGDLKSSGIAGHWPEDIYLFLCRETVDTEEGLIGIKYQLSY